MSDLLERLRALRGDAAPAPEPAPPPADAGYEGPARQLGAVPVVGAAGVHLLRRERYEAGARHGREPLGDDGLHPWLGRLAGARDGRAGGPVLYLDTETTGLAGGTGTLAFLVGVGAHRPAGFEVDQLFLPGPQHERAQLEALAALLRGAGAVVTYNGASFDLPLLRNRFALHGIDDPLAEVAHLDLLPVARRLWSGALPDCTLGTVERRVLGARRSGRDVPGHEVPARYFAFLRSRDAHGLRGVLEHNVADIVALTALRARVERSLARPGEADSHEAHGLGRLLERLGEPEEALAHYLAAGGHREAAWRASLLLRRLGRLDEAMRAWRALGEDGLAEAWTELAKAQEHRLRDYEGALASVEAAARLPSAAADDLARRRERLLRRLARRS